MKKAALFLTVLLALALVLPAAAQKGKKGRKGGSSKTTTSTKSNVSVSFRFGRSDTRLIRDWFSNPQNTKGLPPGLAKREELPPGLKRHLERNGTLPPGLQKKIQPIPRSLRSQLPKMPAGTEIVFIAGNVLVVEVQTSWKILDIVTDIKIVF